MRTTSSTRAEAIYWQLLADADTPARTELFESGVPQRRIEVLYPRAKYPLDSGLRAYMQAGGTIVLNQLSSNQPEFASEALRLYRQLSSHQISAAPSQFNRWRSPISGLQQAIIDHPRTLFGPSAIRLGSRGTQAGAFMTRLMWAMRYKLELQSDEADAYLALVTDAYLPDLLGA